MPFEVRVRKGAAKKICKNAENTDQLRGLGDLIAKFADPIGKALKLDKAKCGCAKRQEKLNELFPFGKT
jgi:hypothetical protein